MPTLTIDGKEISVAPGTNLIEAARQVGSIIPHFCYHPKLSVAGNCRMCLVEIEGARKPEIACNTPLRDGMKVFTNTEKIQELRQAVLEFLFLNHPLDCPICDKAGECKLQDYYLEHGRYTSRLDEGKVRKPKRLDIGTHIILDTERCVLCSRCVRFCDEVTGTGELRIFERGAHSQIGIYPGKRLDNRYSMCTTDVCPVGALTAKAFRFQARVWYLENMPSVCGGCANGCNVEIQHYRGEVKRLVPRRNDAVNDTWMCDEGRLKALALQTKRLLGPCARQDEQEKEASLSMTSMLRRLGPMWMDFERAHSAEAFGVVMSPAATMEENFVLAELAEHLGTNLYYVGGNPPGAPQNDDDGFLIRSDKNPNSQGAAMIAKSFGAKTPSDLVQDLRQGRCKGLLVFNNDIVGKAEAAGFSGEVFESLALMIVIATHASPTSERADFVLPSTTWLEVDGTWMNFAKRLQRIRRAVLPPTDARDGLEILHTLSVAWGVASPGANARSVFRTMVERLEPLKGIEWEALGEGGISLAASEVSAA